MNDTEFSAAFRDALNQLPDNIPIRLPVGERQAVPSMSGIGKCARQQWARLVGRASSSSGNSWQSIMGYAGQALIAATLKIMGYTISDQEKEVYLGKLVGHLDGVASGVDLAGAHVWDSKLRSAYGVGILLQDGIDDEMYLQQQAYCAAEGLDTSLVTLVPFDLGAARTDFKRRKLDADPLINRIFIKADSEARDCAMERASMLTFAAKKDIIPRREFNPENRAHARFPCGFCEVKDWCKLVGQTDNFTVTPIVRPDQRVSSDESLE